MQEVAGCGYDGVMANHSAWLEHGVQDGLWGELHLEWKVGVFSGMLRSLSSSCRMWRVFENLVSVG